MCTLVFTDPPETRFQLPECTRHGVAHLDLPTARTCVRRRHTSHGEASWTLPELYPCVTACHAVQTPWFLPGHVSTLDYWRDGSDTQSLMLQLNTSLRFTQLCPSTHTLPPQPSAQSIAHIQCCPSGGQTTTRDARRRTPIAVRHHCIFCMQPLCHRRLMGIDADEYMPRFSRGQRLFLEPCWWGVQFCDPARGAAGNPHALRTARRRRA
jgi:hypothetical protein